MNDNSTFYGISLCNNMISILSSYVDQYSRITGTIIDIKFLMVSTRHSTEFIERKKDDLIYNIKSLKSIIPNDTYDDMVFMKDELITLLDSKIVLLKLSGGN